MKGQERNVMIETKKYIEKDEVLKMVKDEET